MYVLWINVTPQIFLSDHTLDVVLYFSLVKIFINYFFNVDVQIVKSSKLLRLDLTNDEYSKQ